MPRSLWTNDSKFLHHHVPDFFTSVQVTQDIPAGVSFGPCVLHNTFYDTIAFIALKSFDRGGKSYVFRVSYSCILEHCLCYGNNIMLYGGLLGYKLHYAFFFTVCAQIFTSQLHLSTGRSRCIKEFSVSGSLAQAGAGRYGRGRAEHRGLPEGRPAVFPHYPRN